MSLYSVLDQAYFHFIDFLTDKELYYLSISHPITFNIMKQGFARTITFGEEDDYYIFIDNFNKHHKFINHVILKDIDNPFIWTPIITPKITLQNCKFTYSIRLLSNLTELTLDHTKFNDWDKIPNLKKLIIHTL